MKKRCLSVLLAALMLASLIPQAFAADDLEGHWSEPYITYLASEGVFRPSATTGEYKPDEKVTRAEFMRYVNRAFNFTETASVSYSDVSASAWYYETVQIAERYGYINGTGDGKMNPTGQITREQAATIIGRLYKEDPGTITPDELSFTDKASIGTWSAGYIKAASDRGILSGYTDGSFKPSAVVSRGEVAKILYGYLGTMLTKQGTAYTGANLKDDAENVTITESCTLSDATIHGDLYLTEGLGTSAVTLSGVTVEGRIIVSGGTVNLVNTTSDHMIISSSNGRLLQATATGASHFAETIVRTNATLYESGLTVEGKEGFAAVVVDGDSRVSLTLDAALSDLTIRGDASVSTTANTAIHHMTANAAATVTGYGSIYQADINAKDVSISQSVPVSGYTLADGISASIGGQTVTTSAAAAVSPTSFSVNLSNLSALGTGVQLTLPTGVSATSVVMDGATLLAGTDYIKNETGVRMLPAYLGTLSTGNHTLRLALSEGENVTIAVTVSNNASEVPTVSASFDRYYRATGFTDQAIGLTGVVGEAQIRAVTLGTSRLAYEFTNGKLVLRRGQLGGLRAGVYTIWVDLSDGSSRRIDLTVRDSSPAGTTTYVGEYDTFHPVETAFSMDLSRASVRSVTVTKSGAVQTIASGSGYVLGNSTLTLTKATLEANRVSNGYVTFSVTMTDGSIVTLVVDYI